MDEWDDCWEDLEIEKDTLFSSDSFVDYNEKTASENATTESKSKNPKNGESTTFSLENVSPKLLPSNESLCDKHEEMMYDVQTSSIMDMHCIAISKESGNPLRTGYRTLIRIFHVIIMYVKIWIRVQYPGDI